MNPNLLRAILAGMAMMLLAATSIITESLVRVPLAGEYDLSFLTAPDRICWYDQQRFHPERFCISIYDLETDQLNLRKLEQVSLEGYRLPSGDFVRMAPQGQDRQMIRIIDGETLQKIREFEVPPVFYFNGDLLDQRYMVARESGKLLVCDLLSADPQKTRSYPLSASYSQGKSELMLVQGSNLAVELSPVALTVAQSQLPNPPLTFSINVYRIDADSIECVASWIAGNSDAKLRRQGKLLLSLTPNCLTLEGRDIESLELVRSSPLPKVVADNLPWSRFKQDLIEVHNPQSQWRTVFRLDTLQELHSVEGLTVDYWNYQLESLKTPYRILRGSSSGNQFPQDRLVVYDMDRDEIVFDRQRAQSPAATLMEGGRLAIGDFRYGITAEIYDLKTGQLLKRVRPYAWLLPWYAVWSMSVACVGFAWVYYSARAELSLVTSILLLAAAFLPVQLYPLTQHGTAVNLGRMAALYSMAILSSASAGVVWIGFSQIQNRTMRWTYQMSVLSIIAIALVTLELHAAFPHRTLLAGALVVAMASAYAAFMGLVLLRLLGYRTRWLNASPDERTNPQVFQFFALNAASAALLVACWPFRFIEWEFSSQHWQVAVIATVAVLPYLFVFLLLKMSDRWFARWRMVAFLVAAALGVDFIAVFVQPDWFRFRIDATHARLWLINFIITFLWLWSFRLRGCRLTNQTHEKVIGVR